jgi:dTDP-4-dehydrorhamnose reductase
MRWLVTGAGGMLGKAVVAALLSANEATVDAPTHLQLDITDTTSVAAAIKRSSIVINTAAWTDVDAAELAEDQATIVNGKAVANLAATCAREQAYLLHLSTDYVFQGTSAVPYAEHMIPNPLNAYGRSKLAGERAISTLLPSRGYIVRTAWLYGAHTDNFVSILLRQARDRSRISVVNDQRGQPTWTAALADRLIELGRAAVCGRAAPGIYHGTATGNTTRYEFARAVFAEVGLDPRRIVPVSSTAVGGPALRPSYSVLGHDRWPRAGFGPLASWREQLRCGIPSIVDDMFGGHIQEASLDGAENPRRGTVHRHSPP